MLSFFSQIPLLGWIPIWEVVVGFFGIVSLLGIIDLVKNYKKLNNFLIFLYFMVFIITITLVLIFSIDHVKFIKNIIIQKEYCSLFFLNEGHKLECIIHSGNPKFCNDLFASQVDQFNDEWAKEQIAYFERKKIEKCYLSTIEAGKKNIANNEMGHFLSYCNNLTEPSIYRNLEIDKHRCFFSVFNRVEKINLKDCFSLYSQNEKRNCVSFYIAKNNKLDLCKDKDLIEKIKKENENYWVVEEECKDDVVKYWKSLYD